MRGSPPVSKSGDRRGSSWGVAGGGNQWVDVTGVYKPDVSVALYVNGVKVAEDTTSIPISVGLSGSFRIGAQADNTLQGNWNGQIDEVEIIARAMRVDEILARVDDQLN